MFNSPSMLQQMVTLFSFDEKQEILEHIGYKIENIKSWISHSVYHNDVEYEEVWIWVAYKERPSDQELKKDSYYIENKYGLDHVIQNLIIFQLKSLLFNIK